MNLACAVGGRELDPCPFPRVATGRWPDARDGAQLTAATALAT